MLETGLKQWLDREESPGDFYQLIGQPRLCGNRDLLLRRLEEASEYLFQYQNHKDKHVRDRARTFSRQLAEARRILADESRWKQYDADLIAQLHAMYRKNPNFSGPNAKLEDLKRWLALVQKVDPARVEELVEMWNSESAQPVSSAAPDSKKSSTEMDTQSHAGGQTTELPTTRERRDASHSSTGTHGRSSEDWEGEFETYPLEEARDTQLAGRPGPPPPPIRQPVGGTREGNGFGKAPPPPPKDLPPPPQPPGMPQLRPIAPQRRAAEFHQKQPGELPGSPTLWIAMAAFLAAVMLGMFGLFIAWAAGAFDGNRSRGAVSREESSIVLQNTPRLHPEWRQTEVRPWSDTSRDLSTKHSA